MRVLIDTTVWSCALRRNTTSPTEKAAAEECAHLVESGWVVMIGPIRQEVLSGIRNPNLCASIRDILRDYVDLPLRAEHHERAAEFYNKVRSKGIQGSHGDFIICAAAAEYDCQIMTLDQDFARYAEHLPISLYPVRALRP